MENYLIRSDCEVKSEELKTILLPLAKRCHTFSHQTGYYVCVADIQGGQLSKAAGPLMTENQKRRVDDHFEIREIKDFLTQYANFANGEASNPN